MIVVALTLVVQGAGFGQTIEDAYTWNNRGMNYYNQGDYLNAIECFYNVKEILEVIVGKEHHDYLNILKTLAFLYNSLGTQYYNLSAYENAVKCFFQAKDIYEATVGIDHRDYATCLNSLGLLYKNMGDYAKAETYYLQSLAIVERVLGKDHPDYATSLNNLGLLYRAMGDYAKAETYYLQSLSIREKALGKDHPDYAQSLNNLGELYRAKGDYAKAETYYLQSLSIREKALGKDHPYYAQSLNNLGALYYSMGDYAKAETYYMQSLAIVERVPGKDHPYYAASLNNLGALYESMGDYAKAETYYLQSLSIRDRVLGKDHPDYAASLNNLGALYDSMGDYAKAETYYLQSLSIRERVLGIDHPDYAASLNNLGGLYYSMRDYAKTETYYLQSLSIWEKVFGKDHPDYATSLNNLGSLYRDMGDYAKAETYLQSLSIMERALGKDHPSYITSLYNIYGLYLAKKDYPKAIPFKQEAYQRNTAQVDQNFSFMSEQQRDTFWKANKGSFELTYSLPFHHPVSESSILGYDNALFSKGLLLRTTNAVRDSIYGSGDQALIAQFEELGSLRRQISTLRQNNGNETNIRSLEQQAEALDKSLTQSSTAFRDSKADLAVNWQNIRDSLLPNEAAIEFVSFRVYDKGWTNKTQYAALVLCNGMTSPVWIPLCDENALFPLFAQLDGKRPQEQARILYDDNGAALYNTIWRSLEKELQGVNTVYYSPSGLLHKVSFNAIPAGGGKQLMDVYNLNLVSSTREVVYVRTREARSPSSAVVYGGLQYDTDAVSMLNEARVYIRSGQTRGFIVKDKVDTSSYQKKTTGDISWNYLQFTDSESKDIQQVLNSKRIPVTLFNGIRGNKESFFALSGNKTTVIHLATHGFFNQDVQRNYEQEERQRQMGQQRAHNNPNENPLRRSGLVLSGANTWAKNPVEGAENGILLAEEVAGLNLLGAELIVLSACETALGVVDNSEGVFGLQRAFKLAGAQTLIMSLWKVDDEATSILISKFYENWLSGKSKQDAFKDAQRKVRSNPQYTSPFYWAAFVMMD